MAKKKYVLLYNEVLKYFVSQKNQNPSLSQFQKYDGGVQFCTYSLGDQKYTCEVLEEGNL